MLTLETDSRLTERFVRSIDLRRRKVGKMSETELERQRLMAPSIEKEVRYQAFKQVQVKSVASFIILRHNLPFSLLLRIDY